MTHSRERSARGGLEYSRRARADHPCRVRMPWRGAQPALAHGGRLGQDEPGASDPRRGAPRALPFAALVHARDQARIAPQVAGIGEALGIADLGAEFGNVTGLPIVGNDEALVRAYLMRFLKDAPDTKPYAPFFRDTWLKAAFAETKIVNGIGDQED